MQSNKFDLGFEES